ncbi:MAG TPA: tetratricopeptide repeat protein [Terriglobales bacterium]|nr:tetratricopeptide repeat protein [Terriglobales bacterium]
MNLDVTIFGWSRLFHREIPVMSCPLRHAPRIHGRSAGTDPRHGRCGRDGVKEIKAGVRTSMAFGFGFNKQKVLSAAEKFVQQGKLQNAISEYEKILKNDPKDLTVTNTVGDLYARLGDTAKAVECFKAVGDAYASQGFTVKGIAMYKKISKLAPSVDGSLKLAELYTQQGLFNDARAQYLQVAEDFMKNGELDQAVRLFQKVLEMDPENVSMRIKLAEVYVRLGKKTEAWEIFSAAAEALRAKGSLSAAEEILQRMLILDPGNSYVLLLRGRAALEADEPKKAIQFLEKVGDIDSHPEGLRDLLKAYLQTGNLAQATPLADKLLAVHNDPEGLFVLAEGCAHAGQYHQALNIYCQHADRLLATDSAKLLSSLHAMITHVRDDVGALDILLQLLNKAGESTHVGEVTELMAHACTKIGDFVRARDLYQMLATIEPQNPLHMQNYQQVLKHIEESSPTKLITAEEGAVIVEELEATAPIVDQSYPDDVAIAVRSAITDADLFLSYNLPEKAIVPLLGALPQAPRDVRLNQRLAALHTRSLRFTEAAVCCRTLESVYHEAGYPDEAVRYGDLAARYEERATVTSSAKSSAPPPVAAAAAAAAAEATTPWPAVPPAQDHEISAEPAIQAEPEFAVQEPPAQESHATEDLTDWDHSFSVQEAAATEPPAEAEPDRAAHPSGSAEEIAEVVEEIRFYLEHFMTDQARAAFARLKSLTSDRSIVEAIRLQIEAAAAKKVEQEPEVAEVTADDGDGFEVEVEPASATEAPQEQLEGYHDAVEAARSADAAPAHTEPAGTSDLSAFVSDLEKSLGDSFPAAEPAAEPEAPAAPMQPLPAWPQTAHAAAKAAPAAASVSSRAPAHEPQPAAHVEIPPAPAPAKPAAASATAAAASAGPLSYSKTPVRPLGAGAQAMHPQDSVDLSEMFGELKHELEEDVASADEDPETHYNLGVAFREMGLLDEAIAELQKVCAWIDRGHQFAQIVQTYTWLAQCFLDKGVPEAAIRWFEKALAIPGLDHESRLAIQYELGAACESAHDRPAALRHFTAVYGGNIDYRDVAERIQALKS